MKKWLLLLVLVTPLFATAELKKSSIVAIVNDSPITRYDFNERKKLITVMFNVDTSIPGVEGQLNKDVLKSLIETEILKQHSKKVGGKISDEDVADAMSLLERQNNMPPGGLRRYIAEKGIKFSTFKDQIIGERIKFNIINSLTGSTHVAQNEIESALIYNSPKDFEVEAWVFTSKDTESTTHRKMKKLKSRLKGCDQVKKRWYTDFAEAEKFDRNLKMIDGKIQTVIEGTKVGATSSVYKDDSKYKLVLVCKKQPLDLSAVEEGNVKYFLINKKSTKKAEKFLDELKQRAYVQILDPTLK